MNNEESLILRRLADMVLPVGPWVKDKQKDYIPPVASPWRAPNAKPSINDLDVIGFIEGLLKQRDPDKALAERWRKLLPDPLAAEHVLLGRKNWRRSRKGVRGDRLLETDSRQIRFGAVASGNFILGEEKDLEGGGKQVFPLTRHELYRKCIPALRQTVKARRLLDPDKPQSAWARLLEDMQLPTGMPDWPEDAPPALDFLRQFTKDVFWLALGFQKTKDSPLRDAMPLEAGEFRRPGNAYSPDDTKNAVVVLEAKLKLPPETVS